MTCMVPMAFAGETARWSKPDSWCAKASARDGSTPILRAVSATMVRISLRDGTGDAFRSALFSLAELTTAAGYVKPRNELGTRGAVAAAGCGAEGWPPAPGMASLLPG